MPTEMILFCPTCGKKHLDEGEWRTRLHKTHLCLFCGREWRPYDFPTVGVSHLKGVCGCGDDDCGGCYPWIM